MTNTIQGGTLEACSNIFNQVAQDFGLTITVHQDSSIGKFQQFPGFVIASNFKDGSILSAMAFNEKEKCFWGAEAYYDETKLREHVAKLIQLAKDSIIETKLDNIKEDFKCLASLKNEKQKNQN